MTQNSNARNSNIVPSANIDLFRERTGAMSSKETIPSTVENKPNGYVPMSELTSNTSSEYLAPNPSHSRERANAMDSQRHDALTSYTPHGNVPKSELEENTLMNEQGWSELVPPNHYKQFSPNTQSVETKREKHVTFSDTTVRIFEKDQPIIKAISKAGDALVNNNAQVVTHDSLPPRNPGHKPTQVTRV